MPYDAAAAAAADDDDDDYGNDDDDNFEVENQKRAHRVCDGNFMLIDQ